MLPILMRARLSKCKWHRSAIYARDWSTRRIPPLDGSCANVLAACKTLGMAKQPELLPVRSKYCPGGSINVQKRSIDTLPRGCSCLLTATDCDSAHLRESLCDQFQMAERSQRLRDLVQ